MISPFSPIFQGSGEQSGRDEIYPDKGMVMLAHTADGTDGTDQNNLFDELEGNIR